MHNTEKSFKSVKKLVINEGIKDIQIPNSLFPNVVEIESFSKSFRSGSCLVYVQRYGCNNEYRSCELLNTFCKKEDAVIDLEGIRSLASNAFSGCEKMCIRDRSKVVPSNITGYFFVYKSTAAAPRNFKKNCKKRYTFCFFKHIICVSEKSERTAPVGLAKAGIVVSGCLT